MRPGDHGTDSREGSEPERPIDLEALRADDEFIESLMSGGVQEPTGARPAVAESPDDIDAELRSMLSAWVLDVRPETVTAIEDSAPPVAVGAPAAADPAPATEPFAPVTPIAFPPAARKRQPAWHLRRALLAASVVAAVGSGVAVGAYQSTPGGTLWPMTKVLYAEHARSVQAATDVTTSLDKARVALREGRTGEAADAIREVRAALGQVDPAQGHDALDQLQLELSDQLATVDPTAAATLNLPPSTKGGRGVAVPAADATPAPLTDRAAEAGSAPSATTASAPVVTDPAVPVVTAPAASAPAVSPAVAPSPVEPAAPEAPEPDPATSGPGPDPSVAPADPVSVAPQLPTDEPQAPLPTTVDSGPPPDPTGGGVVPAVTEPGTTADTGPAVATDPGAGPASADTAAARAGDYAPATNAASDPVENTAAVAPN